MKKTKTFTIDENILKDFIEIANKNSLNKSLFIENAIKDYINKNKNNINKNNANK